MDEWVIFGFSQYLSDVFDLVHARGGKVKAIVCNLRPEGESLRDLQRRIGLVGYAIPTADIADFQPQPAEKYCFGFFTGRQGLYQTLKDRYRIALSPLVHPTAYLGSNVQVGEGALVGPGAVIGPNCVIGTCARINRTATLGHDTVVGEFCDVAPAAAIASFVSLGPGSRIGIGASVIHRVKVGAGSIVGAGAAVIRDVEDGVVVAGVPAKFLKKAAGG